MTKPRTVILVPWRTDHGIRERLYALVRAQIDTLGLDVYEADSDGPVFSIAQAWNNAARAAGDWDVALQWGADMLLGDPRTALAAARACTPATPYVMAFDRTVKLTPAETMAVLAGDKPPHRNNRLPFGGPRATHRTAWDAVGWYDERFIGWGHEDRAFYHAVSILARPCTRVPGRMIQLRHPARAEREDDPYYAYRAENTELWYAYRAITDPDAMRRHIEWRQT